MHWLLWICVANGGIVWLEYQYRNGTYNHFFPALPYIIVPILMGQVGLFYGFRTAPNLLLAGITFTIINTLLRIINTYLLGEPPNGYQYLAVLFMLVSAFLMKMK